MSIVVWLAVASVLVAMMQIGFLLLEAGYVRSKNSINVAMKNIADFATAVLAYFLVGAAVMFGAGNGFAGFDSNLVAADGSGETLAYILFQAMFCGTAATIVSGAIAERMQFASYLIVTVPLTAVIYPVIGHWAWASGFPGGSSEGWLEAIGFIDFAGSSVVHLTGGAAALALLLLIGPRAGRFGDSSSDIQSIHGHSPVLSAGGAMLLMVGWLGFNTGGLEPGSDMFAQAMLNTVLAGAAGCIANIAVMRASDGFYRTDRAINGLLSGLVAITASAPFASGIGAICVGGVVAALATLGGDVIERRWKVDDTVYAVAVHAIAGALGTLAVPLVAKAGFIEAPLLSQLAVQALGVLSIGGFAFIAVGTCGLILHLNGLLRISEEAETKGLNVTEHGAMLGHAPLTKLLNDLNRGSTNLGTRVEFDTFQEGGDLAVALNAFLDKVEQEERDSARRLMAEKEASIAKERQRADSIGKVLQRFRTDFADMVADLRQQAGELDAQTGQLSDHANLSGRAIDEASNNAGKTVSIAGRMSEGAQLLADTLDRVGDEVARARLATEDVGKASESGLEMAHVLERSASEIGTLVALIEEISHQTDILALNASIEAARAGKAGKAFAVVSDEVRSLSDKTRQASGEIGDIVESLTALLGKSVAQFRAIGDNVETVRTVTTKAEQSVSAQRLTGHDLSKLIGEARHISEESGRSVGAVSQKMSVAADAIGKVGVSADAIAELAERIDSRFSAMRGELTGQVASHAVDEPEALDLSGKLRSGVTAA